MQNNNTQKAREIVENLITSQEIIINLSAEMATLLKHYGVSSQTSNTHSTNASAKEETKQRKRGAIIYQSTLLHIPFTFLRISAYFPNTS